MTLTLNTTIQFLHKTLWLMIIYYQTKVLWQKDQQFRRCSTNLSYFDHTSPCRDLYLENSNRLFFCMTLQLIMMHHNTEFGNKMCGGLENIIWINIDILTLRCDLDHEGNNPLFPQDALAYNNLSSDQVWLPKNQQFRRYSSQSNVLII